MADTQVALADLTEVRRWPFKTSPTMGLVIRSPDGLVYPSRGRPIDAVIDTGFDYEVLVTNDIYDRLDLEAWEHPEKRSFETVDGSLFQCWEAMSGISIARTDIILPEVPIVTPVVDDGKTHVILGSDFIKRLQILFLGNKDRSEIVLLRHR